MANPKEEGSTDPYKITLSHFGDAMKNSPSRRKPVQRVLDLYDKIRRGGNMNQEVQEKFFNDISDIKWATSLKTAVSTHGSYKALKGNGGRHENRRFSNWVIVSACWPDADKLPDIRANMAKYWGLKIFPDGEFPKVAVDKQLTLYLGKLEKKHPSKSKSRTIGSATDPKGKGPQTPNQGGDHGSIDGDSSGGESEDEAIIDEESTTAAQKARDKSLKEEAQKERNSNPDQVEKASGSSGLATMEKIEKARANVSKAYANRGAKRPADPTPATDSPPAKRASTHSALDRQAIALADLLRDLPSNSERLQKLEEENDQLREENRQLKERIDKAEAAHEKETMDTLLVLLDVAQRKVASEATKAT
ncbi:uncharacterized protein NECHADRAFT_75228 [Fusarium vanettenii 77-13-4]|uniref:Uncharacterized protein n=1 Tax=Fusarium vanettenii (strain ATCC MYA-4622 / CBS 123669 / FGSC 9596 / NRRL 45880 / 77-13-4) TaxID=660122 RepID=C7YI82_FUSV7|nr:uncharacterized protein NECHADRAFT_75228 [Fusarium vanettenii 77-13-4]EEU48054.1 predicted protein [Fusarium vanettenii 77-13-4]